MIDMKKITYISPLFLLIILISTLSTVQAGTLKPFTTDGCSSFPNGTFDQQSLWVNCCISHDFAYWKGGDHKDRLKADQQLESCVAKVGEPEIAKIMLAGVRVGGSPHFNTPFRWGYGWPYPRGYAEVTSDEKIEIKQKLDMLKVMIESISKQINVDGE